jgi:hypothetical protein
MIALECISFVSKAIAFQHFFVNASNTVDRLHPRQIGGETPMHLHTAIDSAPGIAATLRAERPRRKLAASVYCSKKMQTKIFPENFSAPQMESTTTSKNKDVKKMTVPKERNWMLPTFLRRPCHSEIY